MYQEHQEGANNSRPMVLYVKHVQEVGDLSSRSNIQPIVAMDIEMSKQDVLSLVNILKERLGDEEPGSIRVRLLGSLVIT